MPDGKGGLPQYFSKWPSLNCWIARSGPRSAGSATPASGGEDIETFDFKVQPSINQELFRGLMQGDYIDKKENVLLVGNSAQARLTWPLPWPTRPAAGQGSAVLHHHQLVTQLLENREEKQLSKFHRSWVVST